MRLAMRDEPRGVTVDAAPAGALGQTWDRLGTVLGSSEWVWITDL